MPQIPDLAPEAGLGGILQKLTEEPYHEYWYHLGRFVHKFAGAESALLSLVGKISGLSSKQSGVVFHEIRAEAARTLTIKLLEVNKDHERIARLEGPFGQMPSIGTIRNNLVHWGAYANPYGDFTVSNADRKPLKPREYSVSIDHFAQMCADLRTITVIFVAEKVGKTPPNPSRLWRTTWQYKPPQPSHSPSTKGPNRPKRSPPPRASP